VIHLVAVLGALDQPLNLLIQLGKTEVAAILNDELETAGRAKARNGRRGKDGDTRLGHFLLQPGAYRSVMGVGRKGGIAAILERIEGDEELPKFEPLALR